MNYSDYCHFVTAPALFAFDCICLSDCFNIVFCKSVLVASVSMISAIIFNRKLDAFHQFDFRTIIA